VGLLATCLAQRSLAGLDGPLPTGRVQAEVALLGDPAPVPHGGVQVEVGLGGRRWSARAHGAAAASLDDRLAGERVVIRGRRLPPGPFEQRMLHRHLAGRLQVDTVLGWREGHGVTRAANRLRRTLERGAEGLPERQRALLLGLALGDDRWQPADLTAAFRAAGLGHLTAVSGQNVSFLLAAAAPALVRLRLASRLVVTLALLAAFALVTRGEPSVLRATAMAAVGAHAAATGRPSSGLRNLAVAVTGVLLCDPLLVSSLGFQLSVAGAAGIILGAGPLAGRLPGPRAVVLPLATTAAAQLAVAPLLVATFGPLTLAALPANLLAVPAAGPVMVWGLTAGLVAGAAGGAVADVLQAPVGLLLGWVEIVARTAARWPVGRLGAGQVGLLALALLLAETARMVPGRAALRGTALRSGLRGTAAVAVLLALAAGVPP
jgi:competence protein ComEC